MANYDELRIKVANVDALAAAVEDLFDDTLFDGQVDRQRLERCAHLIGMTREAAEQALAAVDAASAETAIPDADPRAWDETK